MKKNLDISIICLIFAMLKLNGMARKMTFGKYKGEPVTRIILTHIGYIMWCLNNLAWFKLTDEEQELYDANAIAMINSSFIKTPLIGMIFK